MIGREPYLTAAATILRESGCEVRKWRTRATGLADVQSPEWYIEVPEPRGPVSYATLAHEVAHQLLHRSRNRPRWQEELEAWLWSLATFERFELPGIEQARADAARCLAGAAGKALRRTRNRQALANRIVAAYPDWVLDRIAPIE